MRTVLSGLFLLLSIHLFAQRECASFNYIEHLKSVDPAFAARINAMEHTPQILMSGNVQASDASNNTPIIRIPVVIHVIYNNGSENISDEQIQSQITALNKDYRRLNADTVNTPARFLPYAADVQIEFVLATADPSGRATNGIVRKYSGTRYWSTDDKIKHSSEGGDDAWDSKSYLNIWVSNLRSLLGYSSVPGCNADIDGVVINYTAFGTINTGAPYNLGRTATHEVGHWMGLKHIWGDTYCGDDLVSDTPPQSTFTPGCPTGIRTSCSNAPLGDMYMNYMDFTNDACMNLFTQGQKTRMRSQFTNGGVRQNMLNSKGLDQPWTTGVQERSPEPEPVTVIPVIYPNPAVSTVQVTLSAAWIGKEIRIVAIDGRHIQSFSISGALQTINLTQLPKGLYFVVGTNGTEVLHEKLIKL